MYTVIYSPHVLVDLEKIDSSSKKRIRKAIEDKLMTQPEIFGKPLRQSLVGYRALRVGNYRVVFVIKNKEVRVLVIGSRDYIYKLAGERLG